MIDFNNLQVVESKESADKKAYKEVRQNYVLGCDLFDQDEREEYSRFTIYDKFLGRTIFKVVTRRDFNWFIDFVTKNDLYKGNYVVSEKFIKDGKSKRVTDVRSESGGFKEYIVTQ